MNQQLGREIANVGSFILATSAALSLTMSVAFIDYFPNIRLSVALLAMMLLHILIHPRILFCREIILYSLFVIYMFLSLFWTDDVPLFIII